MPSTSPIDVHDAYRRLQDGHALLVDVREPVEFAAGHAPGAASLPLDARSADQIPEGIDVMVICRSGGRSAAAARRLAAQGRRPLDVDGGMDAWHQAGLPVLTGSGRPGTIS